MVKLSQKDTEKLPTFVKMVKDELAKKNIKVEEKDLESSMMNAYGKVATLGDCGDGCTNGAHW